jgi:DNA-directed RNA polymerase subunit K/omega
MARAEGLGQRAERALLPISALSPLSSALKEIDNGIQR